MSRTIAEIEADLADAELEKAAASEDETKTHRLVAFYWDAAKEAAQKRQAAWKRVISLRDELAVAKETRMPITDDHGKAIKPQYRVIKTSGNWKLLYDSVQSGDAVRHEFRITKTIHDIALYHCITLEEAIRRFDERVGEDT